MNPGEPSRPPLGGFNIGVSEFSEQPDLAFEAAKCINSPESQLKATELDGLPPSNQTLYTDPVVTGAFEGFAPLVKQSIDDAAPRPLTPAYTDLSLAIQRALHPPDKINPEDVGLRLRRAARGRRGSREAGGPAVSKRTRSEHRLAWMLCAPAVFVMLLVTAYPILYAFVLSLQDVDLRFPDEGGFVGLDNYATVLSSELWWQDLFNTLFVTVISVAIELALGMAIALVMYRAIFARGVVRTAVLIPYGIVTVVAAFAWQFAFDPATGFVNGLPLIADDKAWFGDRFSSFAVIIMAEVWKTTPFMALLLLAGLTTIDTGLYEAAKVDGANAWKRFTKITLPLVKPAILVALLFRTLDAFRVFDTIFIMTRGSQDTESVSILGYNQLISRLNLGLGSAVSVLIFLCVLVIAFFFVRFLGVRANEGRPGT